MKKRGTTLSIEYRTLRKSKRERPPLAYARWRPLQCFPLPTRDDSVAKHTCLTFGSNDRNIENFGVVTRSAKNTHSGGGNSYCTQNKGRLRRGDEPRVCCCCTYSDRQNNLPICPDRHLASESETQQKPYHDNSPLLTPKCCGME